MHSRTSCQLSDIGVEEEVDKGNVVVSSPPPAR